MEKFDDRREIRIEDDPDLQRSMIVSEGILILLRILAPIAPHISHVLWAGLGQSGIVLDANWPLVDFSAQVKDEISLVIQVNGKKRAEIVIPADASDDIIRNTALSDPGVIRNMDGKASRKIIIVPKRLVNIVV